MISINVCRICCVIVALLSVCGSQLEADIIVSFQGGSISAGGTGFVDVFVSSNSDPTIPDPPDILDSFSGHFRITPVGGAVVGGLQFFNPQSDLQLGIPGYIFAPTNSLAVQFAVPVGTVTPFVDPNDDFSGGDGTVDGLGVSLDNTSGQFRLYRFNLDASLANPGDQYEIALVNDGGTQFLDPSFSPLTLHASSFNAFTITAVPEPATGGLLAIAGCGFWIRRRWRSKRSPRGNAESSQHCRS